MSRREGRRIPPTRPSRGLGGQHASTARVPALLLLGSKHGDWAARAKVSPLHAVVNSPFTVQHLRDLLERVLQQGDELAASGSAILGKK